MKKRILGIALAGALAFSALAGSVVTAASAELAPPNPNRLKEYTPSEGVKTFNLNLALPGFWTGEDGSPARATWEKYDSSAGLYWWGSLDNPDEAKDAAGHGWPGWKMKKGDQENLYSSGVPKNTASMIFSNFIDGGMDTKYPEYDAAMQTKDLTQLEYIGEGDSDYFPKEFWDYVYSYSDDFADNPNFQIPGFGDYAKNFFLNDDDTINHYLDDMVFVVDIVNTKRAAVSPVSGKAGLDGGFYFYYGNGEFGIWPTKELCIEKEGLKTTEGGKEVDIANETVQERTDFVTRKHIDAYDQKTEKDVVVFGNFTGKYWTDKTKPVMPEPETTAESSGGNKDAEGTSGTSESIPNPSTNDAGSNSGSPSDSGSGSNDSNGSIATGDFSAVALIGVVAIAGLGVFYFIRRRRSSK